MYTHRYVPEAATPDHRSSARLREERQRQELSIRELAHFARCSPATIQRLENGSLDVAPATKARIARALRIPSAELWPETRAREGRLREPA
jgi:transcriptional regulator with XRE-family HTH domain